MKRINQYISAALMCCLLAVSFTACTEDFDIKLNSTYKRLVVDGIITTDTVAQYIKLTQSGDYFDNQPMPAVSNALVTLNDGETTITLTESPQKAGYYYTPDNFYGKQGHTYTLNIDNVDINNDGKKETYSASSYLNPIVPIESVGIGYTKDYKLWQILLYAYEPKDIENYYMFSVSVNDLLITDQYSKLTVTTDEFVNGNYMDGIWVYSLDPENEEGEDLEINDTVTLKMYTVTEETFKYMNALAIETQPKTPLFSGAPANVPGNLSNGALGVFAATSVSRAKTIVRKSKSEY
jgi:hypothetical protein